MDLQLPSTKIFCEFCSCAYASKTLGDDSSAFHRYLSLRSTFNRLPSHFPEFSLVSLLFHSIFYLCFLACLAESGWALVAVDIYFNVARLYLIF